MSVLDRVRENLFERVEEWTGLTVRDVDYVQNLEESDRHWGAFADEAEDLAEEVLGYLGGQPREATAASRRMLAARSRTAFIRDPIAGAEANLRANFALGRGIPPPQAPDPAVQKELDRFWNDPKNSRKLTSFEAQRKRSNDLLAGANLYPVAFEKNGHVRIGFHNEDLVTEVVMDDEDDETPLWYVVRKRKSKWDFDNHHPDYIVPELEGGVGLEKVFYYEHWRNVEDGDREAEELGMPKPRRPKAEHILPGKMMHVSINRIGRTEFGVSPWARTLRFYSALNQITEAQVQMRMAASTIIAKRVRRGTPRDIAKTAANVAARAGELAATKFGGGAIRSAGPGTHPDSAAAPPPVGSWDIENEGDRLEAVRLSSGAGEAVQDAEIVRAPIAAASGFGPHYLGAPGDVSLSNAATLELPTSMEISAWQQILTSILKWGCDLQIEAAVRAGALGGMVTEGEDDGRPLNELRLAEDREEMEKRTQKDLSYKFELPYPGRRNLPDVLTAVDAALGIVDPNGTNQKARRIFVDFAIRHGFLLEDSARIVDEILPEDGTPPGLEAPPDWANPAAAEPGAGGPLPKDPREKSDQSQYGERRRSGKPPDEMAAENLLREVFEDPELRSTLTADADEAFRELLANPHAFLAANGANGATPPASR